MQVLPMSMLPIGLQTGLKLIQIITGKIIIVVAKRNAKLRHTYLYLFTIVNN